MREIVVKMTDQNEDQMSDLHMPLLGDHVKREIEKFLVSKGDKVLRVWKDGAQWCAQIEI